MIDLKQTFILLVAILFLILSVVFNRYVIDIRLDEMDHILENLDLDQFSSQTFSIVSRYELIKKRIESGSSASEDYNAESRIQAILSEDTLSTNAEISTSLSYWNPVNILIRSLRFILGKEQIKSNEISEHLIKLERGHLLERSRQYEKAALLYDEILSAKKIVPKTEAIVLLHKGFCLSIIGNYNESVIIYKSVAKKFPNSSEATLSLKLLDFIKMIQNENSEMASKKSSSYEIGKSLFTYMDYKGAVTKLDNFIKNDTSKEKSGAHFYKGRAHEELGDYIGAVDEYKSVMHLGEKSDWSRMANRRLVMLGEIYQHKTEVTKEAKEILVAQGDSIFVKDLEVIKELGSFDDTVKVEPREDIVETLVVDSIVDTIATIDSSSLVDSSLMKQKIEVKRLEDVSRATARRIARNEKKQRAVRNKKRLASLESRSPKVIKETIQKEVSDIKNIYLNFIAKGVIVEGEILIEMDILASGDVVASITKSDIRDKSFKKEIISEVESWKFLEVDSELGKMTVSYPFQFYGFSE
jgi:tetratricopeptide (TPR) repeat protein